MNHKKIVYWLFLLSAAVSFFVYKPIAAAENDPSLPDVSVSINTGKGPANPPEELVRDEAVATLSWFFPDDGRFCYVYGPNGGNAPVFGKNNNILWSGVSLSQGSSRSLGALDVGSYTYKIICYGRGTVSVIGRDSVTVKVVSSATLDSYLPWGEWRCRRTEERKNLKIMTPRGTEVLSIPYCSSTTASCFPNTRLCYAADKSICCPGNFDTEPRAWKCATEHVDITRNMPLVFGGVKIEVQRPTYFDVAACVPPLPAPPDRVDCGTTSGDGKQVYCDKNTQECVTLTVGANAIRHCQPTVCPGGEIQKGTAGTDFANQKRCCAKGKGFNHFNGMPDCTGLPSKTVPSPEPPPPLVREDTAALCADGSDNDGDSLIDLRDPDCSAFVPAPPPAGLTIIPDDIPVAPAGNSALGRLDLNQSNFTTRSARCRDISQRLGDALRNRRPFPADWLLFFFCSPKELADAAKFSCPLADLQRMANLQQELADIDKWLADNPLNLFTLGLRFLAGLRRGALQTDLTNLQNSCQPVTTSDSKDSNPRGGTDSRGQTKTSCFTNRGSTSGALPSSFSGLSPDLLNQILAGACR